MHKHTRKYNCCFTLTFQVCAQGLPQPAPTQHRVVKAWEIQLKLTSASPKHTHHRLPSGHRPPREAVNILSPTQFRAGIVNLFHMGPGFVDHVWSLSYSPHNLYSRRIHSQLAGRSLPFPGKKAPARVRRLFWGPCGESPYSLRGLGPSHLQGECLRTAPPQECTPDTVSLSVEGRGPAGEFCLWLQYRFLLPYRLQCNYYHNIFLMGIKSHVPFLFFQT